MNNPLSYADFDGRFVFIVPLTYITFEALFYASIGAVATYAAVGAIESSIQSGGIPFEIGEIFSGALGGIAGSMINTSLENFTYTPSTTPIRSVAGDQMEFLYLAKKRPGERRSSDELGSPPYRGDKLPSDGAKRPGKGFEWKGKGKPGSGKGKWVKDAGKPTQETLYPDLNHAKPIGSHWDYEGPDFPGVRLFPNGTWGVK